MKRTALNATLAAGFALGFAAAVLVPATASAAAACGALGETCCAGATCDIPLICAGGGGGKCFYPTGYQCSNKNQCASDACSPTTGCCALKCNGTTCLGDNIANCSACGTACPNAANATVSGCVSSVCQYLCNAGFKPCNDGTNDCCADPCANGVLNNPANAGAPGLETDVDCGGGSCPKCPNGKICLAPADCITGSCTAGICGSASCVDGIKNGGESDVDCGGATVCPRCANGKACTGNNDCQSRDCDSNLCDPSSCSNGIQDNTETDVDCGGAVCWNCKPGQKCSTTNFLIDCDYFCQDDGTGTGTERCTGSPCADGVQNNAETAIDCGGGTCNKCANGKTCSVGSDCQSGNCNAGICSPCDSGSIECGSSCCNSDEQCFNNESCVSNQCLQSIPGVTGANAVDLTEPTTDAACRLVAGSLSQASMDNQGGEDASFFMSEQNVPSLLIVVDDGTTMRRLPQDPACAAAPGCKSALIDSFFDMTMGSTKADPNYGNLFDPDKWYVGAAAEVHVTSGCKDVEGAFNFNDNEQVKACEKATGDTVHTTNAYKDCMFCLTGVWPGGVSTGNVNAVASKGYYIAPTQARVWSGRFLNVYPPKCVLARNLLKSPALVGQTKVRYGVAKTLHTEGDKTQSEKSIDFFMSGVNPNQCTKVIQSQKTIDPNYEAAVNHMDFNVSGSKPLAQALFNAGQYLEDEGRQHRNWFGNSWVENHNMDFDTPELNNNKSNWCSTCQKGAIVILTDGKPDDDDSLPKSDADLAAYKPYTVAADCSSCTGPQSMCVSGQCWTCNNDAKGCWEKGHQSRGPSYLPAVAALLNDRDLRTDWAGDQKAQTFTIGLGIKSDLLQSTALRGGGEYYTAYTGKQLEEALQSIITSVSSRAMSVAAPSLSTLQTKSGSAMIVPRFIPNKRAAWEGELYKFTIFSEFAAGCKTAGQVLADGSKCVCHGGKCDGLWTLDKNKDFVGIREADGSMVLLEDPFDNATWANGVPQPADPPTAAVPYWSAQDSLRTLGPDARKIYTVIDTNADGKIDYNDGTPAGQGNLVEFTYDPADASNTQLKKLMPYLGLGVKVDGDMTVCDKIAGMLSAGGVNLPNFDEYTCAKAIISWVRGKDALNETRQAFNPANYPHLLGQRYFILGDVFHSSPIRVDPPLPKLPLCDRGFHNQCVRSLYKTDDNVAKLDIDDSGPALCGVPAADAGKYDAYERYVHKHRERLTTILVGANDGMLHSFQLGCSVGEDPITHQIKWWEGSGHANPLNSDSCSVSTDNGTELWAFIPPDLLPRLAEQMVGTRHPYLVDATPMVRDVWVDGGASGTGTKDRLKRCDEYHTMAIFGERRGGTHYTALDITDPANPKFRWTFPQLGTPEELTMGETWSEYLPGAPPIGPVRLKDGTDTAERWILAVGGGYDPRRVRGNQLYMVDVWTGTKIWEARQKTGTSTEAMVHPFAAMPALVAWGAGATTANFDFNSGYFDTAIIGDIGGQVWVARFHDAGVFATNPYKTSDYAADDVQIPTNWRVARGFEEARDDPKAMLTRPPFFNMAASVRMPVAATLRAFIGTGDRYNLRQWDLGYCTLDDPIACARAANSGLNATVATLAPMNTQTVKGGTNETRFYNGDDSYSVTWELDSAGAYTRSERLYWGATKVCGAGPKVGVSAQIGTALPTGWVSTATPTVPDAYLSCSLNASNALLCDARYIEKGFIENNLTSGNITTIASSAANANYFNRYIAFKVFGDANRAPFTSDAEAVAYDGDRLSEEELVNLAPFNNPSVTANEGDEGWYMFYPGLDERTATNSTIFYGCALWSTVQASPPCINEATGAMDASKCQSACTSGKCVFGGTVDENSTCGSVADCPPSVACVAGGCFRGISDCAPNKAGVATFMYQASAISGGNNCELTSSTGRRFASRVVVPPPPPQEMVEVDQYGRYKVGVAVGPSTPRPPPSEKVRSLMKDFYSVEVPLNVHQCRHVDPPVCQ